jgi:hypothetical protein
VRANKCRQSCPASWPRWRETLMGSNKNPDRSLTDLIATLLGILVPRMKFRTVKVLEVTGGLSGGVRSPV